MSPSEEAEEIAAQISVLRAKTALVRARTASVLVLTEVVCLVFMGVGFYRGSALTVVFGGIILLGTILSEIRIAIANVGDDIYRILTTTNEPD